MGDVKRLCIDETHADLWCAPTAELAAGSRLAACEALLSDEERAQQRRYVRRSDQILHAVSRALLRSCLSRYADVTPAAWRFVRNDYGKPALAGPPCEPDLRFNLSHTAGLVVLLVARGRDVGVDAEDITRSGRHLEHPEHFFSAEEVRTLRELPAATRRRRFFEYWTLKEAYIKARGMGLALPLQEFSFTLAADGPPQIAFSPALPDDPEAWQFHSARLGERHQIAAAILRGAGPDLQIVTRRPPAIPGGPLS